VRRARGYLEFAGRILRDIRLILGEAPADGTARSPWRVLSDLRDYAATVWAARAGDVDAAAPGAGRLLAAHPDLLGPNQIWGAWSSRRGELSAALASVRKIRAIADSKSLERRELDLTTRLLEMDPSWLPTVAGPATRMKARSPRVVMHLLKASLPDRQSGYTIRSVEVLRAQVEVGLEPFVVTPYGYPPMSARRSVPTLEVVDGIRHYRLAPGLDIRKVSGPDQLSRTATLSVTVIRRERPALIHAASGHRGYENALVALALKQRLGIPMVYEVRGFLEASWTGDEGIARDAERAELTRLRMATEERLMKAADGVATLGEAMRDELISRGIPEDKIVVVPNGVDPEAFLPRPRDPELVRRYGLEGRWVFGYISNIDHFREGHAQLIEATARLVAAGRPVACLLVGDGNLRPELQAAVASAGLGSSVIFTGRVPHDEVQAHYALLDAFVVGRLPDRASRFVTPLKPYEAMAMGIPVVVSDLAALTEIATPDERGLVFPVGDVAALEAVLGRLIDHPELGPSLAAAARDWVIAERTWSRNGPRYADLYRSILDRAPAPASRRSRAATSAGRTEAASPGQADAAPPASEDSSA
jgi:glycosyltransferase involved in cell wall biosynthesis